MDTDLLVRRLCEDSQRPVRPLAHPARRAALWFALAAPWVAAVVLLSDPRADLANKAQDLRFLTEQAAALATAILAAYAAFAATVPGHSRAALLLPLAPLAVWLGVLGAGCIDELRRFGFDAALMRADWYCVKAVILVGAGPAVAIAAMLRRGAPISPFVTAALGGLAAAGLGNFGLRLFHPEDASIMVLVWQVGTVMTLSALAGWAGRHWLCWKLTCSETRRRVSAA